MIEIKDRIYQHFYTRKKYFILGKPILTIRLGKDHFTISGEARDGVPIFKVDHGVAHIYFSDVESIVEFIEKHKDV